MTVSAANGPAVTGSSGSGPAVTGSAEIGPAMTGSAATGPAERLFKTNFVICLEMSLILR